jgi:hypothetical protein
MRRTLPALVAGALLASCAVSPTPRYDARFGDAVREAKQRMTLNATAARTDPVTGVDGNAAREAQTRYQESFRSPPPTINVINIGGEISTGSPGR